MTSLLASILWNFTINRKYTFKSANNVKIAMFLVLAFYAIFTPSSTILSQLAVDSGANEYLVTGITMILNFVPMYNAPKIRTVIFGKPIKYNPNININEQRTMIYDYLKEEITRIAKSLPVHKVVPYNNIKKRNYPISK